MASKVNIEQLEGYLKQAGVENGELEKILTPIKELNNQRRYGLVWEEPDNNTYGTDSAEQELLRNFPFLKEVNEHRIFNGEEHPDHLLIEGDNLHALKAMQYTHKNKIDVIYIDPPYNTGNTDFVYNDKYVDNEDSWRHSKWLSFMNKRLRLARELMTDEGVIFISIDDNEQAQLKLLCDQVFGEGNNLGVISTVNNLKGRSDGEFFATSNEFLIVYAKDKDNASIYGLPTDEEYDKEFKFKDNISRYKKVGLKKTGKNSFREDRPNMYYPIYYDEINKTVHLENKNGNFIEITPEINGREGRWRWGRETFTKKKYTELEVTKNNKGDYTIYVKMRNLVDGKPRTVRPKTTWIDPKYDSGNGTRMIKEMDLGEVEFTNPKPIEYIKDILRVSTTKDSYVLDFFAGSGTTAHAVMELNKEDGGNRQAIVITNNEINSSEEEGLLVEKGYVDPFTGSRRGTKKHSEWLEKVNEFKQTPEYLEFIETDEYKDLGIARAVTEQRINKVINGYTTPRGKEVEGLSNNNFYHFEVVLEPDLMDMDLNTYVLVKKTKDIIRMKEGVYTEEEDISTETTPAVKLVNEDKEVIVVLSVRVTESDIEQLINNFTGSDKEHIIYTSYTGYDYDLRRVNFKELPKELLHAIKHNENN